MLYTAKCYWPGIDAAAFERVQSKLLAHGDVVYCGAILFPREELVLCLFDASSRAAVKQATERVRVPCERVIDSVWVPAEPSHSEPTGWFARLTSAIRGA